MQAVLSFDECSSGPSEKVLLGSTDRAQAFLRSLLVVAEPETAIVALHFALLEVRRCNRAWPAPGGA
jgi:hypothetical protein